MTSQPVIYALCPDRPTPLGGIKIMYRHVDVLNKNGFPAFILHQKKGFRCRWFQNQTPVVYANTPIQKQDYLIVPEIYGPHIAAIKPGIKKVIFNQNAYLTFTGYPLTSRFLKSPYQHPDVKATVVVSEDSRQYLHYAFQKLKVFRTHNAINPSLFRPGSSKKAQIAFMPRKIPEDAVQIVSMLRAKNLLKNFKLAPIQDCSESEVARILKESLIFLSLSAQEGCALPPMEAMACGCVVVGYNGRGGKEYFKKDFCYPVREGDIIGFVKILERLIRQYPKNKTSISEKGRRASAYIQKKYSLENEERQIVRIWKEIFRLSKG